MAVATIERPIQETSVSQFDITPQAREFLPWPSVYKSGIPADVIFATAGYCFKYQATFECLTQENNGVEFWRKQEKEQLMQYVAQTPQSLEVYRRLRLAQMIIHIDPIEDLLRGGV